MVRRIQPGVSSRVRTIREQRVWFSSFEDACEGIAVGECVENATGKAQTADGVV